MAHTLPKHKSLGAFAHEMFMAGVSAGFSMTKDGFNAECPFDHLIPSRKEIADYASEERARLVNIPKALALAKELALDFLGDQPCPAREIGTHDDPDNSGGCIYCGLSLEFDE